MKSYTDLQQSKKLAEILPLESADMYYWCGEDLRVGGYKAIDMDYDIPCWSLAALLSVLPQLVRLVGNSDDPYWYCECVNGDSQWYAGFGSADNPIDACYEMILKLNKINLL